jgi:hypothetical protein
MKKTNKHAAMLSGQNKSDEQVNEAVDAVLNRLAKTDRLLAMGLAQSPKSVPMLESGFVDELISDFNQALRQARKPG